MPYSTEVLYGDTAQVQHGSHDLFGSGRLIGRNLVLTARHVVMPEGTAAVQEGWQVRLHAARPNLPQADKWIWIDASVEWTGQDILDLALLKLRPHNGAPDWYPKLQLRIGRIDEVQHHKVRALGFPRGARVDNKRTLFVPSGDLDNEKEATLSFGIDQAYQPESPGEDWRGFSGAAVLLTECPDLNVVWIYGVVQQVPQSFTRLLAVARLAKACEDKAFCTTLEAAEISLDAPADPGVYYRTHETDRLRNYIGNLRIMINKELKYVHELNVEILEPRLEDTPGAVPPKAYTPTLRIVNPGFFARHKNSTADAEKFDNFASAFDCLGPGVLLLGAPGTGKTTVLLDFARLKIAQWLADSKSLLPVFAPIHTWEGNKSIVDWLAEMTAPAPGQKALLEAHLLRKKIEERRVLLLLDGLDELRSASLERSVQADLRVKFMNVLADEKITSTPTVVSCRIQDYREIAHQSRGKIALTDAVTLEPLSDDQIRDYLRNYPSLVAVLETDQALRDMVRNPFVLAVFTVGYRDMPKQAGQLSNLADNPAAFQSEIFKTFVGKCYEWEKQRAAAAKKELPPCTEQELYEILGRVASKVLGGGLRLSLGEAEASWAEPRESYRKAEGIVEIDSVALRSLLGPRTLSFISFALRSHLLVTAGSGKFRFAHALVRDGFARSLCLNTLATWNEASLADRRDAIGKLGLIRDLGSLDRLINPLDDEDEVTRATAAWSLGEIGHTRAIEPLVKSLRRPERKLMAMIKVELVVEALEKIGTAATAAVAGILEKLEEFFPDPEEKGTITIPRWHLADQCVETLGRLGEAGTEALVRLLGHRYEFIRVSVIRTLGEIKAQRALEALVQMLSQEPRGVVTTAIADALRALGDGRAVQPLIEALRHPDLSTRCAAAAALGELGDKAAIDPLLAVNVDDLRVRYAVNDALEKLKYDPALLLQRIPSVETLANALHSEDKELRRCAIWALGKSAAPAAADLLAGMLNDPESEVRAEAARELGTIGGEQVIEPLLHTLHDPESSVRRTAVNVFLRTGDSRVIQPLIAVLSDPDRDVKDDATRALSRAGAAAARPLIAALRDEHKAPWATKALVEMGETAVGPLLAALRDGNQQVREFAMRALAGIGTPAVQGLVDLLGELDHTQRAFAARALGQIGDVRAICPLIGTLEDSNEDIRISSLRALAEIGEPAVERCLDAFLRKPSTPLAVVLAALGSSTPVDRLTETLRDPATPARLWVPLVLADIGATDAVAPLAASLGDKDPNLRHTAAAALGKLADARAVAPLLGVLNDVDDGVRGAAIDALKELKLSLTERLTEFAQDKAEAVRTIAAETLEELRKAVD